MDMHFVEPTQAIPVDVDALVAVAVDVVEDETVVPFVVTAPVVVAPFVVAEAVEAVDPAPPALELIGLPLAHAPAATMSEAEASRPQSKRTPSE